jgi:hypothetical protein
MRKRNREMKSGWMVGAMVASLAFVAGHSLVGGAPVAAQAPSDVAALKAEIEVLRRQLPDQAHVMTDVDYHFANLWFAGQNANWSLADFYLNETRAHLNWAVRVRPVRRLSTGQDLDLAGVLQGIEKSVLTDLRETIAKRDAAAFAQAYRAMSEQCSACHAASEKPFLRVRVPESPASHMINMRPAS